MKARCRSVPIAVFDVVTLIHFRRVGVQIQLVIQLCMRPRQPHWQAVSFHRGFQQTRFVLDQMSRCHSFVGVLLKLPALFQLGSARLSLERHYPLVVSLPRQALEQRSR